MKKFLVISLILFLVLLTAFVKNSTKTIEDKIFVLEENIRSFRKDYENVKLEFDYLSSADKLSIYQEKYFDREFFKKDISQIEKIIQSSNKLKIEKLKIINE
tara:strand:+ start:942 stop:1247 length:306 start_codon:yes stop_codon:yes gene_type:complete